MVIDLAESRRKIDEIDKEIIRLFQERMDVANDVAAYKRSTGKKVYDPQRENEKIAAMRKMANNEFNETAVEDLFRQIMSISRKYQYQKLGPGVNHIPFREVEKLDVNELSILGKKEPLPSRRCWNILGIRSPLLTKQLLKK